MSPEYLPVPDQSLEAGHAELVLRSPWLPAFWWLVLVLLGHGRYVVV